CLPIPECKNGQSLIQGYCGYCPVDGCDCPDGKILRKNHETNHFYCADCRPFDDSVCQSCHISFYMFNDDHSCHCPESTHLIEDGICLDRNSIISYKMLNSYSTVTFKENRFKSKFLFDSLRPAIHNCRYYRNQTACQYLINVCTMISIAHTKGVNMNGDLCDEIERQIISGEANSNILKMEQDNDRIRLYSQFRTNNMIDIVHLELNPNGSIKQYEPMFLNQLFRCAHQQMNHEHLLMGVHIQKQCLWNQPEQLWDYSKDNNYFYQLYLLSAPDQLNSISMNFQGKQNITRFFLFNTLLSESNSNVDFEFLIYAKHIALNIVIDELESNSQTFYATIHIDYDFLSTKSKNNGQQIRTELTVNYRLDDDDDIMYNFHIFTLVFSISLSILWSSFRTWSMMNRNRDLNNTMHFFDWQIIPIFINYIIISVSNILACILFVFIMNRILVFKYQSMIRVLIFTNEHQKQFVKYLIVIFICKIIEMTKKLFDSTSIEIFFIDWERPRKRQEQFKRKISPRLSDNVSKDSNRKMYHGADMTDVSIWRSYFVANEWIELSIRRRINIALHLFLIIIILETEEFRKFCKLAPQTYLNILPNNKNYADEIPECIAIRISTMTSIYFVLILIQYFYKKVFKENFICNKLDEFIDLCSVSNVSIIITAYI
ncbi:hypothetical protein BLA29_000962, partial [Euroglyphus maynei]